MSRQRLLAIVTDSLQGGEPAAEIRRRGNAEGVELHLVVPAVEESSFRHVLGDVDGPARDARERLRTSLAELGRHGLRAEGEVGDADPVLAAQDALRREGPVDEVLIFERAGNRERWFEDGLFERAQEELDPPLRMVVLGPAEQDGAHVLAVEEAGAGRAPDDVGEVDTAYSLPPLSRRDLAGMTLGIVGTIVAIILAAAGPGPESGWGAVSILVAIGIALVNMAHVVGMTLFESVHYRGGFQRFFAALSLVGTPLAVVVNLLILLLA